MMTRTFWLAALLLGLLTALCTGIAFSDISYAQTPAAMPAQAPAVAAATPPACDAKILENCTFNSGDTAWMMTSVALVLMMTVPGLGLFYGGMVRKKNVGDTVMTAFAITCLVTVLFALITYSLAFTEGSALIGGLSRAFLLGVVSDGKNGTGSANALAPTIPESVYMCFQMTFAIITPALIAGAFAADAGPYALYRRRQPMGLDPHGHLPIQLSLVCFFACHRVPHQSPAPVPALRLWLWSVGATLRWHLRGASA
jgi:Amt family ammonium transporter